MFVGILSGQVPDKIPTFSKFISMETGEQFTSDSLDLNNIQVFVLIDPGCGHCQELGQGIAKSLDQIREDVDFYFISMQEKSLVDGYINMFAKELKTDSRVKFLYDPEAEFYLNFNPKNFPSTYIFEAETLQLIKQFDGDNNAEMIVSLLKK